MKRWMIVLATAGVLATSGLPSHGAPGAACSWGGSPGAETGVFTVEPALRAAPAEVDLAFTATGELAGDDARCTGVLTFRGKLWEGASCRGFINSGIADGIEDVAAYLDGGGADSQGVLYAPGRSTRPVATFNALVFPTPELVSTCATVGLAGGAFSSVVVWLE